MSESLRGQRLLHWRGAAWHATKSQYLGHDGRVQCGSRTEWHLWRFLQQRAGTATPCAPAASSRDNVPGISGPRTLGGYLLPGSQGLGGDRNSSLFPVEVADFAGTRSKSAGGSATHHLGDIKHDPAPLGGMGPAPVCSGGLAAGSSHDSQPGQGRPKAWMPCRHTVMEVRTLPGWFSLPPCGSQGSNSGCQPLSLHLLNHPWTSRIKFSLTES